MGLSLPIIGALLGHSSPSTTARYAHLVDDVLKAATAAVGAQVIPIGGRAAMIARDWLRSITSRGATARSWRRRTPSCAAEAELWRERHAGLLAATDAAWGAPGGRPGVQRHARRRRREAARQQAVEEIPLAMGKTPGERLGLDITQPACAGLTRVGIRWQLREENRADISYVLATTANPCK